MHNFTQGWNVVNLSFLTLAGPLDQAAAYAALPADQKSEVETAIADAKKALEGTDVDAIRAAGDKLTEASQKLAQIVYSTTDEGANPGAGAGAAAGADDVVDAEYEVVDDDKNN